MQNAKSEEPISEMYFFWTFEAFFCHSYEEEILDTQENRGNKQNCFYIMNTNWDLYFFLKMTVRGLTDASLKAQKSSYMHPE